VSKPNLRIDIRDARIPDGGRFTASARTTRKVEARRREAAVRTLIDRGEWDLLRRITATGAERLHIADVERAVAEGDLDSLRIATHRVPLAVGAMADLLMQRKRATRSEGTQDAAEQVLRSLEAALGVERDTERRITRDVRLRDVDPAVLMEWLHGPKSSGEPWAPRTQGVAHAYASELWKLALALEADAADRENRKARLTRSPWATIRPAEVLPTRVIYLTAPERDALLARIVDTPQAAFMAAAYHAGLRLSEARYLRTGIDVDLGAGVLRIQPREGAHKWRPKTKRGTREVPINRTLARLLARHIELGFAGERFFFRLSHKDEPLSRETARSWWSGAYDAAEIKWGRADVDAVVYHTGRHTFASLLVQQGVSPLIVAELLGDKYEEVVRTYGHLSPHNLRDAVRLLETDNG
jgi:hypothetical protein